MLSALLQLWNAGRHREAVELLIPKMLVLSPKTTEEMLRRGLRFDDDGRLRGWSRLVPD